MASSPTSHEHLLSTALDEIVGDTIAKHVRSLQPDEQLVEAASDATDGACTGRVGSAEKLLDAGPDHAAPRFGECQACGVGGRARTSCRFAPPLVFSRASKPLVGALLLILLLLLLLWVGTARRDGGDPVSHAAEPLAATQALGLAARLTGPPTPVLREHEAARRSVGEALQVHVLFRHGRRERAALAGWLAEWMDGWMDGMDGWLFG